MGYFNDEFTKQKLDLKEGIDIRHVQVGCNAHNLQSGSAAALVPSLSVPAGSGKVAQLSTGFRVQGSGGLIGQQVVMRYRVAGGPIGI